MGQSRKEPFTGSILCRLLRNVVFAAHVWVILDLNPVLWVACLIWQETTSAIIDQNVFWEWLWWDIPCDLSGLSFTLTLMKTFGACLAQRKLNMASKLGTKRNKECWEMHFTWLCTPDSRYVKEFKRGLLNPHWPWCRKNFSWETKFFCIGVLFIKGMEAIGLFKRSKWPVESVFRSRSSFHGDGVRNIWHCWTVVVYGARRRLFTEDNVPASHTSLSWCHCFACVLHAVECIRYAHCFVRWLLHLVKLQSQGDFCQSRAWT